MPTRRAAVPTARPLPSPSPLHRLATLVAVSAVLVASPFTAGAQEPDPDVTGSWEGVMDAGPQGEITMIFRIASTDDGGLESTLDVPTQGATGIATGETLFNGDTLTITVPVIGGRYEGILRADGTIEGTWSQGPAALPLDLRPGEGPAEPERPQHPRPPFPYIAEDIRFPNPAGGFELAGTFTRPEGDGPFPAVLLISGSGPQDRDETVFGHKPFLVLADHLTRAGVAVLRFDDRGVGASGGEHTGATSEDFASDVAAGVAWLEDRPDVHSVGLVGHSEGGLIAPLVAADDPRVDFVVLLAGPGVPGSEILPEQQVRIAEASGVPASQVAWNRALLEEAIATVLRVEPEVRTDSVHAVIARAVASLDEAERIAAGIPVDETDAWVAGQARALSTPWMAFFFRHDPRGALARVDVPVLAVSGSRDLQVPPDQNLLEIERALSEGGNERVTVVELPDLNHLFQTTETGSPSEYGTLTETFAPAALDVVSGWILEVAGG